MATSVPDDLPPLAELLRWVQEMPVAFSEPPAGFREGKTPVHAVVADLVETVTGDRPKPALLKSFQPRNQGKVELNRLLWVLAGCHLLWHPSLRTPALAPKGIEQLLTKTLAELAEVVPVDRLRQEEERREELIRKALHDLDLRLPGESPADAEDRLSQVDSVERQRLLREAASKEKRAREIREQMARQAAQEAAARYSPE